MDNNSTKSGADRLFRRKMTVSILFLIAGAVLIALFLRQMQQHSAYEADRDTCKAVLNAAVEDIERNYENADALEAAFHSGNQAVLAELDVLMRKDLEAKLDDPDSKASRDIFMELMERSWIDHISVISKDGRIILSPAEILVGLDAIAAGLFTKEDIKQIYAGTKAKDGTVHPVKPASYHGSYYFYSMPYEYKGKKHALVIGAEATELTERITSLRDISGVLSRESADDATLIFAVDKSSGDFIYCKTDKGDLSGKNISNAGLSESILSDGYDGEETVNGERVIVMSEALDDETVICAAAKLTPAGSVSSYMLIFSMISFSLIMLICLIYTIAVRSDYVREATETDKVVIRRKDSASLYFDRSVFRKVFPLMITAVLVIFGISFYSNTLIELSDCMNRSRTAVSNISSKYGEDLESKDLVRGYYNDLYISRANILALMLEEDPSPLNAHSTRYHFYYDEDGNRQYARDGDGKRIKSVASSRALKEFCDRNDLKSVYIFDEEGRTIGTNTGNWFYTISRDKDDQSYPFLEVLDGRKASYAQDPMTDDLGNYSQYIGVPFSYYTRDGGNGNIEYVTKEEYKNASKEGDGTPSVTAHSSMIQIGLDTDESAKLSDATDFTRSLSENALGDGSIELFSSKKAHKCLYSPDKSKIGKTAKELEIPSEAFSGRDYCSFDGVSVLSIYQYDSGYFFRTILQRSYIFRNRLLTALITSLISLILILIMTAFVTITTEEEERLYAGAGWLNGADTRLGENPTEILVRMVKILMIAIAAFVIILTLSAARSADENSMVRFMISGDWDRGFNLFALSKCAFVLLSVAVAVNLLKIPLSLISSIFGARGETIGRLLISVTEYGGSLAALFYCLYLLGVDSSSLLASAGLMTLVIGFGAQSLIKDIISGLFMVFEGEFHVGDIVTIEGFRGVVQDIGLRTTKVMGIDDEEGNLKIFNNSEITGVLNMTREPSWVVNVITIEYDQDLEYVEEVLRRELPAVTSGNPMILTGPEYKKVNRLGENGVELIFHTTCAEKNIRPVTRYINRCLLQIFRKYDINIPATQIIISGIDESGRKTLSDLEEKE